MLQSESLYGLLFHLLDVGLNQAKVDVARVNTINQEDWERLFSLSMHHEMGALVSDSLMKNDSIHIPIDIRLKFVGLQEIAEQAYLHHQRVLSDLLALFSDHGIPTMIIKGFSLAQYYPVPSHRKCGDIDIYQFGHQPQSDELVSKMLGIGIHQYIVSHHSNYCYKGVGIENHYQFITTYYKGNTVELESMLEDEAVNAIKANISMSNVFFPSPILNAVFLICHMAGHFRGERVTLRQLLDWMMFLKNEYGNVDWKFVYEVYKKNNLLGFVNAINGILMRHLGMSKEFVFQYEEDRHIEQRILYDMLNVTVLDGCRKGLFSGVRHEWSQYIVSGWKFRLFNKYGCVELLKKVTAFLLHHNDFVDKEVYPKRV